MQPDDEESVVVNTDMFGIKRNNKKDNPKRFLFKEACENNYLSDANAQI
jgi:hypothetical protein